MKRVAENSADPKCPKRQKGESPTPVKVISNVQGEKAKECQDKSHGEYNDVFAIVTRAGINHIKQIQTTTTSL